MRKIIYAALFALLYVGSAYAQSTSPVLLPGGCGTGNITNGIPYVTVDSAGRLCGSGSLSPYPTGSAPVTGNATGTTGAVVGTLAAATGKTTYICGFDVSAIGGTDAVGPITIAGTKGGSLVYELASSAAGVTLSRTFTPCIPASAANTAITTTTTANANATAVAVNSWGFQQ